MRFRSTARTNAEPETAFAALTDPGALEAAARRRGMVLVRRDAESGVAGSQWTLAVNLRGRPHEVAIRVTEADAPARLGVLAETGGVEAALGIDASPLPDGGTHLALTVDIRPRTLAGRLLLAPLLASRGPAGRRIDGWLAEVARGLDAAAADPRLRSARR